MFTGVYGPIVDSSRESFWEELGSVRGLWNRRKGGRMSSSMRHFSKVIGELELRDIPLQRGPFIRMGPKPFHFENMWLKAEGFKDMLRL